MTPGRLPPRLQGAIFGGDAPALDVAPPDRAGAHVAAFNQAIVHGASAPLGSIACDLAGAARREAAPSSKCTASADAQPSKRQPSDWCLAGWVVRVRRSRLGDGALGGAEGEKASGSSSCGESVSTQLRTVFALGHLGLGKKIAAWPYSRFSPVEKRAFFSARCRHDLIDKPLFYIPFWLTFDRL